MKTIAAFSALLLGSLLVVGLTRGTASADTEGTVGLTSINLTNAQVLPDAPSLVRAFIPTGSGSVKCLVSMNETTFVESGAQLFCGQRTSPTYGPGILITINYFSQPVPPEYGTSLTIWQQGARYYGNPIMCEAAGAC